MKDGQNWHIARHIREIASPVICLARRGYTVMWGGGWFHWHPLCTTYLTGWWHQRWDSAIPTQANPTGYPHIWYGTKGRVLFQPHKEWRDAVEAYWVCGCIRTGSEANLPLISVLQHQAFSEVGIKASNCLPPWHEGYHRSVAATSLVGAK